MTRQQLVEAYRIALDLDAGRQEGWAASDAAWEALCAWDNAHREELPAWQEEER